MCRTSAKFIHRWFIIVHREKNLPINRTSDKEKTQKLWSGASLLKLGQYSGILIVLISKIKDNSHIIFWTLHHSWGVDIIAVSVFVVIFVELDKH